MPKRKRILFSIYRLLTNSIMRKRSTSWSCNSFLSGIPLLSFLNLFIRDESRWSVVSQVFLIQNYSSGEFLFLFSSDSCRSRIVRLISDEDTVNGEYKTCSSQEQITQFSFHISKSHTHAWGYSGPSCIHYFNNKNTLAMFSICPITSIEVEYCYYFVNSMNVTCFFIFIWNDDGHVRSYLRFNNSLLIALFVNPFFEFFLDSVSLQS